MLAHTMPMALHSYHGFTQEVPTVGPPSSTTSPHSHTIYPRPLRGQQIRLLALQPRKNNEHLVCHLRIVDVADENLSYEAVSYVWGSQDTPATIYCRDDTGHRYIQLPIPQSAADALEAFREPQDERLLWIDSICISQASVDEKSTQVAMMDLIFSKATTVLIWLGSDSDFRPAAAAELFDRMAVEMLEGALRSDRNSDIGERPCYADSEVETLLNVFECDWVWRLWCVQELVLAKKALVHWATVKTTWDVFSAVAMHVQAEEQAKTARNGLAGVYNVTMLEIFRRQLAESRRLSQSRLTGMVGVTEMSRKTVAFSRLLSLTRMHGVTDRRDRIFSLLGLDRTLCHVSPGKASELPLVTPNYEQKIEDLYTSIAKKLLCREQSLYLLSFVQHQGDVENRDLPSWVPQWHINDHRLITQFDLVPGNPVNDTLDAIWLKSEATSIRPPGALHTFEGPFHISEDGVLQVNGLLLATVSARCSEGVFTHVTGDESIRTLRRWFQDVVSWFTDDEKDHIDSPPVPQDQVRDVAFRVLYKTVFGGHLRHRIVRADIQEERDAFQRLLYLSDDDVSPDRCPTTQAFVTQICRSRKVFLTTDGQLGIGPKCVHPGDAIFYLSSAAVPLLLRSRSPAQHRWALLGEVYVNGMISASDDYGPQPPTEMNMVRAAASGTPTGRRNGRLRNSRLNKPAFVYHTTSIWSQPSRLNPNPISETSTSEDMLAHRDKVNNVPHGNAQHPYDHRKRRDGTHNRVQRPNTFMFQPQGFDSYPPPPRIGNEGASRTYNLVMSSESKPLPVVITRDTGLTTFRIRHRIPFCRVRGSLWHVWKYCGRSRFWKARRASHRLKVRSLRKAKRGSANSF
jgi:hypothetical protein